MGSPEVSQSFRSGRMCSMPTYCFVSCPEPSSGQNVPLSHWSVGFMFDHLCKKGDGAVVCAISGVGLGRRAAQRYNLLRHGPQAPFERLCCNSILSAA